MNDRELNRALLARQHLLERTTAPLRDVVEQIGALQGQAWGALPVDLWSRVEGFTPPDLYRALDDDELRWGIGLRGTLHLVSAREHPAYARAAGTEGWARALKETSAGMDELRAAVLEHCAERRTGEELAAFADAWVAEHPDAIDTEEVEAQQKLKWRPIYRWARLQRVPDGPHGSKAPDGHRAAGGRRPAEDKALAAVVARHLGAFGPATVNDVAQWIGRRPGEVRDLVQSYEEVAKGLYDLPDAPRPGADTDAPPRFLGAFDSTTLAHASKHRSRLVPDKLVGAVYKTANLQVKPTFLLDGFVAGTWSVKATKTKAAITLEHGPKRIPKALREEGEALLRALYPDVKTVDVSAA